MKKTILAVIAVAFLLHLVPAHAAQDCKVLDTQTNTVLADKDCDVHPDNDDNCPDVYNPDQKDSNLNGIGDACETNRPPVAIQARSSVGLQLQGRPAIAGGQGSGQGSGSSATDSGSPPAVADHGALPAVSITYVTTHGLEKGGPGEFYAVNVHNDKDLPVVVSIAPQDISPWGSYTVMPDDTIIVQPGKDGAFYLFVKANFNAEPGRKSFSADVIADNERERLPFEASVVEGGMRSITFLDRLNLQLVMIILIVIILVVGIILGYQNYLKKV